MYATGKHRWKALGGCNALHYINRGRMERTENGAFIIEGVTYIPWRHYSNRLLWQVNALWGEKGENFCLLAEDVVEAVRLAHKSYKNYVTEEKILEEMESQWKLEKANAS